LKAKIEELEANSKTKNIRNLYRGINDFKRGYRPRTNIVKADWLQTPTVFWLGGGTFYISCWIYMVLMLAGSQKYTQQNHYCLSLMPLRLRWLLKS